MVTKSRSQFKLNDITVNYLLMLFILICWYLTLDLIFLKPGKTTEFILFYVPVFIVIQLWFINTISTNFKQLELYVNRSVR